WAERYACRQGLERRLAHNGTRVLKFFLHLSKEEQRKRFLARLDDPAKNWKFSLGDIQERKFWSDYQDAYEEMVRQTRTKKPPWYVGPADHKWYTRLVVAAAIVDTLAGLDLAFPEEDRAKRKELEKVREALLKS